MDSNQRLIEIETKVSYQDVVIDDLQKMIYIQSQTLEKLEKNLKLLSDRIEAGNEIGPGNQKPPHY